MIYMPIADQSRDDWARSIAALLDTSITTGQELHSLLRNIACHYIFEQHVDDRSRDVFDINIAPVGEAKIKHHDDGSWTIESFKFSPSFIATANETLRVHESNLYREQYEASARMIKRRLQQFREDRV